LNDLINSKDDIILQNLGIIEDKNIEIEKLQNKSSIITDEYNAIYDECHAIKIKCDHENFNNSSIIDKNNKTIKILKNLINRNKESYILNKEKYIYHINKLSNKNNNTDN